MKKQKALKKVVCAYCILDTVTCSKSPISDTVENKRNEMRYSRFPQLNPPKPKGQLGTENNKEFQQLSCANRSPEQGWWGRRRAEQSPYLTQVSFSSLNPSSQAESREKGREHHAVEPEGISQRCSPGQPHLQHPGAAPGHAMDAP